MKRRYYCAFTLVCVALTVVSSNTAKVIPDWIQRLPVKGVRAADQLLDKLCDAGAKRFDPAVGVPDEESLSFADAPDNFSLIVDAACQEDGRIVVVGWHPRDFSVARFYPDGSLDESFGRSGRVVTDFGFFDTARSVAIQTDRKLIVVGFASNENGGSHDFALARYDANGWLDQTFGDRGLVRTSLSPGSDQAECVLVQTDGKILVSGFANGTFVVVRYHDDGSADESFGSGGVALADFESSFSCAVDLAIQPDDKVVAVGRIYAETDYGFAIARYHCDGSLDTGFGSLGMVVNRFTDGSSCASKVSVQPDGTLVVIGEAPGESGGELIRVCYDCEGRLDTSSFAEGFTFCEVPSLDRHWLLRRLEASSYFDTGVLECLHASHQ